MKKFLLMVIAITVIGCQSNTQEKLIPVNDIIGTWNQVKEYKNDVEVDLNHCDLKNFIIFKSDNSAVYAVHEYPTCDLDDGEPYSGVWKKLENGFLELLTDEKFKIEFLDENIIKVSEKEDLQGDFLIFSKQ